MTRPISSMLIALAALAGLGTALPAAAQFAKPEDAIKYRQGAFTVMAAHFGRVAGMAQGKIPFDAKAAAQNTEIATMMSSLPFSAFGPGTDKGNTKAKPEVWAQMDKFNAGAKKMQEEMTKLNVAAKGGSLDAIKAAVGDVGKACKGCHDDFRAK